MTNLLQARKEIVATANLRVESALDRMLSTRGVHISHINMNKECNQEIAINALRNVRKQECFKRIAVKEVGYDDVFNQLKIVAIVK